LPLHPYQPMSTGTPNALTGLAAQQTFAKLCTPGDAGEASRYAQVAKACFFDHAYTRNTAPCWAEAT